jgi:hypothetical protein
MSVRNEDLALPVNSSCDNRSLTPKNVPKHAIATGWKIGLVVGAIFTAALVIIVILADQKMLLFSAKELSLVKVAAGICGGLEGVALAYIGLRFFCEKQGETRLAEPACLQAPTQDIVRNSADTHATSAKQQSKEKNEADAHFYQLLCYDIVHDRSAFESAYQCFLERMVAEPVVEHPFRAKFEELNQACSAFSESNRDEIFLYTQQNFEVDLARCDLDMLKDLSQEIHTKIMNRKHWLRPFNLHLKDVNTQLKISEDQIQKTIDQIIQDTKHSRGGHPDFSTCFQKMAPYLYALSQFWEIVRLFQVQQKIQEAAQAQELKENELASCIVNQQMQQINSRATQAGRQLEEERVKIVQQAQENSKRRIAAEQADQANFLKTAAAAEEKRRQLEFLIDKVANISVQKPDTVIAMTETINRIYLKLSHSQSAVDSGILQELKNIDVTDENALQNLQQIEGRLSST